MTTTDIFKPVSNRHPCRVCNHVDGCLLASIDATVAAICRNVESSKRIGDLGYLHLVVDRGPVWGPGRQAILKAARKLSEESTE